MGFCVFKAALRVYSFIPPAFGGGSRGLLGGLTRWGHPASLQQGWDGSFRGLWFSAPLASHHTGKILQTSDTWRTPCAEPVRVALEMQISIWMKTRGISPWDAESRQSCLWMGLSMVTCEQHPKLWLQRILPAPLQSPCAREDDITVG